MLTFFQAIILGIVEGVTEFLPISSTGHLIITAALLRLPATDFLKTFEIAIQVGAIIAVIVLYASRLLSSRMLLQKAVVAFIPTGVIGLLLYKVVKQYLLGNTVVVVWSLIIGGMVLVLFEWWRRGTSERVDAVETISYRDALLIGLFQALALIPGVSRAAATVVGGMLLGYSRKTAVEFSFILAIPTMLAASALDLVKNAGSFSADQVGVLMLGLVIAGLVAAVVVRWLLRFIRTNSLAVFGWYRIVIGIVFWLLLVR